MNGESYYDYEYLIVLMAYSINMPQLCIRVDFDFILPIATIRCYTLRYQREVQNTNSTNQTGTN